MFVAAKSWKQPRCLSMEQINTLLCGCLVNACVCVCVHVLTCPILCDQWTVACQAPLSTGFYGQGYWSGFPFPPPGDFPDPGIGRLSPATPVLAGRFLTTEPPGKHLLGGEYAKMRMNKHCHIRRHR